MKIKVNLYIQGIQAEYQEPVFVDDELFHSRKQLNNSVIECHVCDK